MPADEDTRPSLMVSIQEQLGLELAPKKGGSASTHSGPREDQADGGLTQQTAIAEGR